MKLVLVALLISLPAWAENYKGTLGAETVSDFEPGIFTTALHFHWQGDPFAAVPGYSAPRPITSAEAPTIQATMPNKEKPLAVVNDSVVGIGGHVNGKRVRGIGENYILLEDGASVTELSLAPSAETPSRAPASVSSTASAPEGSIRIEERPAK